MKCAIFGASGLVGTSVKKALESRGNEVLVFTSSKKKPGSYWSPAENKLDPNLLENCDAVFNFAGANIAGKRWNTSYKKQIRDSRVKGSALIAEAINQARGKECTFVSASAVGIYGDQPGEELTENSPAGEGFLADVAREWEEASNKALCRVILPRISMVLSPKGGALEKLLPIFRLHLGGRVGSGEQVWSWISLEDLTNAALFLLDKPDAVGAYNFAAPGACTNAEFTKALASALNKTAYFPLPEFMAKIVLGEFAEEALLASTNAPPKRLLEAGYKFEHPDLSYMKEIVG